MIDDSNKRRRILAFRAKKGWQFDARFALESFEVIDRKGATHRMTVTYAPLEWVNTGARLVIVGITPGEDQARRAYETAKSALLCGVDLDTALRAAKHAGSFGGEGGMRERLVAALNLLGFARLLHLSCSSQLFEPTCSLGHFTSMLKFPVFVGERGYDGKTPVRFINNEKLMRYHREFFMEELSLLKDALFLPLGETARDRLAMLAQQDKLDSRQILPWLMHPSKNNRNRYKYLLGEVASSEASGDTNVENVDAMRNALQRRIGELLTVGDWQQLPDAV